MKEPLLSGGRFAEWLVETSLHASVLIGLVLLAQHVFQRQLSAKWRHLLWWLVLARLLLPFAPSSSLSLFGWIKASVTKLENARGLAPAPLARPETARGASPAEWGRIEGITERGEGKAARDAIPPVTVTVQGAGLTPGAGAAREGRWPGWLWRGWLAGVLFFGGGLWWRQRGFFRGTRDGEPVRNAATLRLLTGCQQLLGVAAAPVLVETRAVAGPALCGWWRPRLLLPPGLLASLSEREARHVFLHELAHLKRRDIAVNWLLALAQILHWFNPLVWFAGRQMRADAELAADELVLSHAAAGENHAYGRTILKLLESAGSSPAMPSVAGMMENRRELRQRISMISGFRRAARWPVGAMALLTVLVLTGLTDAPAKSPVGEAGKPNPPAALNLASATNAATGGELLFQVLDARTGLPLAGAELVVSGCDDLGCRLFGNYTSLANGPVSVRHPGVATTQLNVRVVHAGFVPKVVNWFEESNERIPGQYIVKLEPAVTIGGEVRDASGAPVPNVRVRLLPVDGSNSRARETPGFIGRAGYVRTDADGRWRCDFAPADLRLVRFRLEHPDFIVTHYTHPGVPPGRGPSGSPLASEELLALKAKWTINSGQIVKGMVTDASGQPVAGARLLLGEVTRAADKIRLSDENGRFEFRNREPDDRVLTVQASGYAPELRCFEGYSREDALVFKLSAGAVVRGRVVDDTGTPLGGVSVSADGNTWRRERTLEWETRTGPAGDFIWDSAPPDTLSFQFLAEGHEQADMNLAPGGAPHTVTLHTLSRISGAVVDAVTKRPIPVFQVTGGFTIPGGGPQLAPLMPVRGLNGQYTMIAPMPGVTIQRLHFEAPGYKGATIEGHSTNGISGVNNVVLELSTDWSGVVVTPEGRPVAGAQVAAHRMEDASFLRAGQLERSSGPAGGPMSRTAGDGSFTLAARPFATSVVIAHEHLGFAEVKPESLTTSSRIVLQPWAKVEGVSRIGARPFSDVSVMLVDRAEAGLGFSFRWQPIQAQPDAGGKFTLDLVPPGRWFLARRFRSDPNGGQRIILHPVELLPGRVNQVVLGGRGRPVTGRARVSEKLGSVTWSRGRHQLAAIDPGADRIPHCPVDFKPDGSFRVEDVEPGAFELRLQLNDGSHHPLASRKIAVTVPSFDGERSDEPLDIGEVELELSPWVMAGGVPVDFE